RARAAGASEVEEAVRGLEPDAALACEEGRGELRHELKAVRAEVRGCGGRTDEGDGGEGHQGGDALHVRLLCRQPHRARPRGYLFFLPFSSSVATWTAWLTRSMKNRTSGRTGFPLMIMKLFRQICRAASMSVTVTSRSADSSDPFARWRAAAA